MAADLKKPKCAQDFKNINQALKELGNVAFDAALGQLTAHTENGQIVMDNGVMGYTDGRTITLNSWVNWADPNNTAALLDSKPWIDRLINAEEAYLGASSMTTAQFMDFILIHELNHYNSTIGDPDNQGCAKQLWKDCVQ